MYQIFRRNISLSKILSKSGGSLKIDKSKVPKIVEEDLEEKFIKGWGAGGQAVNKTSNAVFLRHIPSGVWIKCHESRSLEQNRKSARKLLVAKLDFELNGEDSVTSQEKRLGSLRKQLKREKTRLKYEKKKEEMLISEDEETKSDQNVSNHENKDDVVNEKVEK